MWLSKLVNGISHRTQGHFSLAMDNCAVEVAGPYRNGWTSIPLHAPRIKVPNKPTHIVISVEIDNNGHLRWITLYISQLLCARCFKLVEVIGIYSTYNNRRQHAETAITSVSSFSQLLIPETLHQTNKAQRFTRAASYHGEHSTIHVISSLSFDSAFKRSIFIWVWWLWRAYGLCVEYAFLVHISVWALVAHKIHMFCKNWRIFDNNRKKI